MDVFCLKGEYFFIFHLFLCLAESLWYIFLPHEFHTHDFQNKNVSERNTLPSVPHFTALISWVSYTMLNEIHVLFYRTIDF